MALIQVYDKRTGELAPNPIPEHWLDNPKLGAGYSRTKPTPKPVPAKPEPKEK